MMWPALFRLLGLMSLTTLVTNVDAWLREKLGTNDGQTTRWYASPFVILFLASAIVYFIYKVLGKKISIK
jgi:hypothetical protein